MVGYTPTADRTAPAYPAPGDFVVYKTMYPISATKDEPMMNGPRRLYLFESSPMAMVAMQPQANGGMVRSCACAAVKPSSWTMVGVKSWSGQLQAREDKAMLTAIAYTGMSSLNEGCQIWLTKNNK